MPDVDAFTKLYSDRIPESERELECVYCEKTEEFLAFIGNCPEKEGVCWEHYVNPPKG